MKTKFKSQFVVALFVLLLGSTSCFDEVFIEGNGIYRSELRPEEGFDEIASSGDFKVTVVPGDEYSVEVTAESNLLPYVETAVSGHKLRISTRGLHSLRQSEPIEVFITTPVLNGLSLSGSGTIKTGAFLTDHFKTSISGSGNIDAKLSAVSITANVSGSGTIFLEGDANNTEYVISGSGKIKSYNLDQIYCQAAISGSGDAYVNASESLDVRISGSGRIYYINNPVIHSSISGSGKVVDRN